MLFVIVCGVNFHFHFQIRNKQQITLEFRHLIVSYMKANYRDNIALFHAGRKTIIPFDGVNVSVNSG